MKKQINTSKTYSTTLRKFFKKYNIKFEGDGLLEDNLNTVCYVKQETPTSKMNFVKVDDVQLLFGEILVLICLHFEEEESVEFDFDIDLKWKVKDKILSVELDDNNITYSLKFHRIVNEAIG